MPEPATSNPTAPPHPARPPDVWTDLEKSQRAALAAGAALMADWAGLVVACGEQASRGLAAAAQARADAPAVPAVLLSAFQRYVAGVADLPRIAGLRFYAELERLRAKPSE